MINGWVSGKICRKPRFSQAKNRGFLNLSSIMYVSVCIYIYIHTYILNIYIYTCILNAYIYIHTMVQVHGIWFLVVHLIPWEFRRPRAHERPGKCHPLVQSYNSKCRSRRHHLASRMELSWLLWLEMVHSCLMWLKQ